MASRRLVPAAAIALLAALVLAAPAAQAGTGMVATCTFPPGNTAGWFGGSFTFSGQVVCASADALGPATGGGADGFAGIFDIDASGTSTLLCGTGGIRGTAALTGGGTAIYLEIGATLAAGTGPLSIVVTGGTVQTVLGRSVNVTGSNGLGALQLTPDLRGGGAPCGTPNLVGGSFELTLTG